MAVRRTTLDLEADLVEKAIAVTGSTLRATVEAGLRRIVEDAKKQVAREERLRRHLLRA